jgi:hypothetical protein
MYQGCITAAEVFQKTVYSNNIMTDVLGRGIGLDTICVKELIP